jgi:hypothetical protein
MARKNRMRIKRLIIVISILCMCSSMAYAYLDEYPPYKFKDGPPKHLQLDPLVSIDKSDYVSKDGSVIARLNESFASDLLDFSLKVNNTTLVQMTERELPMPYAVYQVDLDGNGLYDYIVFYSYHGNSLASLFSRVEIFLAEKDGVYNKISCESQGPGVEDFVDLDNDGKYEVIITDLRIVDGHTYFTYNIYEFKDYKLVNADAKFKGFPKFIWYTFKSNDKDTTRLTKEERALLTKEKNDSIKYLEIK